MFDVIAWQVDRDLTCFCSQLAATVPSLSYAFMGSHLCFRSSSSEASADSSPPGGGWELLPACALLRSLSRACWFIWGPALQTMLRRLAVLKTDASVTGSLKQSVADTSL